MLHQNLGDKGLVMVQTFKQKWSLPAIGFDLSKNQKSRSNSLTLSKRDKVRGDFPSFLLVLVLIFGFNLSLKAQSSLGQPDEWISSSNSTTGKLNILGNHSAIGNQDVQASLNRVAGFREQGLSLFLVVQPKFFQSLGSTFFKFKGVELSDSAITFRGAGKAFAANYQEPLIISASFPVKASQGALVKASKIDTSLYTVFEIIAYNRSFTRTEIRQIETYLSLKYSIPTTVSDLPAFRNYPSDSAQSYYWNKRNDNLFDQEVVALGNFKFSGLLQSQSSAYHRDSIIFALDSIYPLGSMPSATIQEGSFLVLSQRVYASSTYSCEYALNQAFPITSWRLRPINWNSNADTLKVYYKKHHSGSFTDTIILTNGLDTIPLRTKQSGTDLYLSVPLAALTDHRVYQFRIKSNACLDSSTLGIAGVDSNSVQLFNLGTSGKPKLQVHQLNGANEWLLDLPRGRSAIYVNRDGQYEIQIISEDGQVQDSYLIQGLEKNGDPLEIKSETGNYESISGLKWRLYPNPQVPREVVWVEIKDLYPEDLVEIFVHDAQGKMLAKHQKSPNSNTYKWEFSPPISGFYTVSVRARGQVSSQKLLILKSL